MGRRESFTAIIRVLNRDLDFLCGGAIEGYKIAFHLPNELPHVWKKQYHVSANQAAMFMVAPNLISTPPTLRRHPPMIRQCYFNGERQLKYYQYYSQHNCEEECLTNYTLKECGCVQFAMPSKMNVLKIGNILHLSVFVFFLGSPGMKMCGTRRLLCLANAENGLYLTGAIEKCNCLPSCSTLTYDIEPNLVEYDFLKAWSKSKFPQAPEFER